MDRERRRAAVRLVFDLLCGVSCDITSNVLDIVVRSVSLEAIIAKAKISLADTRLIDKALEEELKAIQVFCLVRRPWSSGLIGAGLHLDISYALQRQRNSAVDHTCDNAVIDMGGHVIKYDCNQGL